MLLFYDPVKRVIANTHSGWQGTFKEISVNTVNQMIQEYNSNPSDIICCMAPSISKEMFEVDEDLYQKFYDKFKTLKRAKEEIAKIKMPDLNAASVEAAMSMIAGTCRSMGVKVEA